MLRRISVPIIVAVVTLAHVAFALDLEKLGPSEADLERVKKFERLMNREELEKAQKFEHLKDTARVPSLALPQTEGEGQTSLSMKELILAGQEREQHLFYLFSKSVPGTALESVFAQAKKLRGVKFSGVLRGIDYGKEVIERVKKLFETVNIEIRINPLIFRNVEAEMVPAFVYALCPPEHHFRADACEYAYVVYGDMTLLGALEIMGDRDTNLKAVYEELKNAF